MSQFKTMTLGFALIFGVQAEAGMTCEKVFTSRPQALAALEKFLDRASDSFEAMNRYDMYNFPLYETLKSDAVKNRENLEGLGFLATLSDSFYKMQDLHYLTIYRRLNEAVDNDLEVLALFQSGLTKNLNLSTNAFQKIYAFSDIVKMIGLRAQLTDIFADGFIRNLKLVAKEVEKSKSTVDEAIIKLSPELNDFARQDFEKFLEIEIRRLEKERSVQANGFFALDKDGTPSEKSLVAAKVAHAYYERIFNTVDMQTRELQLNLNYQLKVDFKKLKEKYESRLKKLVIAGGSTPPRLNMHREELKSFNEKTNFNLNILSDAGSTRLFDEFMKTGLIPTGFSGQSWWTNSSEGFADITGATSRSLSRQLYGDNVVRKIFWPNNNTDRGTPLLNKVRMVINNDKQGNPLSLEVMIKSQTTKEWEPFFFERKADRWALQETLGGESVKNVCLKCHSSGAAGTKISPRPKFLKTPEDFLKVGYKNHQLIEGFLKY